MDVQVGPSAFFPVGGMPAAASVPTSQSGISAGPCTSAGPMISPPAGDGLAPAPETPTSAPTKMRKRKAETQDNERLSKRLSLLNIEQNGSKLYVPVESPAAEDKKKEKGKSKPAREPAAANTGEDDNSMMRLDDSKHKVYIYDLDDELSSSDNESDSSESRLVFIPDIKRHLLQNRIPPAVLANRDGELAGMDMQMVLYNHDGPASLTVPPEQDSVRKAILEARSRIREKQQQAANGFSSISAAASTLPEKNDNDVTTTTSTPATPAFSELNGNTIPDEMELD